MGNQIRFIKDVLYSLKREYGFDCTFQRTSEIQKDYLSGIRATTVVNYTVKKVIRLPDEISRLSNLDFLFKEYSMSPKVEQHHRVFLVDAKSLPAGYVPIITDVIIMNNVKYKIIRLQELDNQLGYFITGELNA